MPKKISTMFSHEQLVGVKCSAILGFLSSQAVTLGWFVGGVVVADDAQPDAWMCLGDAFEEGEDFDVGVARVAGVGGDFSGGDLECGEQAGGAVADVVVGLLRGDALAQRQNRLGAIQGLALGLLVNAGHDRARGRIQKEPDHVAQLGLQLGVGGELEGLDSTRCD